MYIVCMVHTYNTYNVHTYTHTNFVSNLSNDLQQFEEINVNFMRFM